MNFFNSLLNPKKEEKNASSTDITYIVLSKFKELLSHMHYNYLKWAKAKGSKMGATYNVATRDTSMTPPAEKRLWNAYMKFSHEVAARLEGHINHHVNRFFECYERLKDYLLHPHKIKNEKDKVTKRYDQEEVWYKGEHDRMIKELEDKLRVVQTERTENQKERDQLTDSLGLSRNFGKIKIVHPVGTILLAIIAIGECASIFSGFKLLGEPTFLTMAFALGSIICVVGAAHFLGAMAKEFNKAIRNYQNLAISFFGSIVTIIALVCIGLFRVAHTNQILEHNGLEPLTTTLEFTLIYVTSFLYVISTIISYATHFRDKERGQAYNHHLAEGKRLKTEEADFKTAIDAAHQNYLQDQLQRTDTYNAAIDELDNTVPTLSAEVVNRAEYVDRAMPILFRYVRIVENHCHDTIQLFRHYFQANLPMDQKEPEWLKAPIPKLDFQYADYLMYFPFKDFAHRSLHINKPLTKFPIDMEKKITNPYLNDLANRPAPKVQPVPSSLVNDNTPKDDQPEPPSSNGHDKNLLPTVITKNMLPLLLLLLTLVFTGCGNISPDDATISKKADKSTAVFIACDASDKPTDYDVAITADEVIKISGLDKKPLKAVTVKATVLNDVATNRMHECVLDGSSIAESSVIRQSHIRQFGSNVDSMLHVLRQEQNGGLNESYIYLPLCRMLEELSKQPCRDKILIVHSNMLENNRLSTSFYKNADALIKQPDQIINKLEAVCTLPDLSGITIYLLWQPDKKDNTVVHKAMTFWHHYLSSKGAAVEIAANI